MDYAKIKNKVYETAGKIGHREFTPVFVIGSGRCGTTLFVSILNSHAGLVGFPGEANDLWHPGSYPFGQRTVQTPAIVENPRRFTEISLNNWPEGQNEKIQRTLSGFNRLLGRKKKFFSKSAMISFMIPAILSIFPNAKFIHMYRNGPSVVASLLKKEWYKYDHYFESKSEYRSYCASYWNDCIMEIEARKNELALSESGVFYEFSYEQLCETPLSIMNDIAGFFETDPDAFTFDISQISSKNYKIGDYKNEASWRPLLDIMAPAMQLKGYETR